MVCISGSNVLEYRLGSLPKKKVWITICRQPTVLSLWLHTVLRVFLLTRPVWEVYCLGWPDEPYDKHMKSIWHVQLFRYHMETKSQLTSQPFNMRCFCCGEFSCPVPSCLPYWGPCHRFTYPRYLFSSCFPAYILLLPLQGYVLFCHHWLVLSSLFYTSHGYFEISTSKIILVLVVEVDDGREWAGVYVGMLLGLLPDLPPPPYLSLLSFFCKRPSLVTELGLNSA